MMADVFSTHTQGYVLREEQFQGKKHIVAPVILMTPGVHNGSNGPVLYTEEELAKYASSWNGRPVPVLHPENDEGVPVSCNTPEIIDNQTVGWLFNTRFEGGKLRGEIWVDEAKAQSVSPLVMEALRYQRPMEVSTGLFSDFEPVQGTYNEEQYAAVARNIRPDHLALLPGGKGACSWEDGCGVRANKEGGGGVTKVYAPQNFLSNAAEIGYQQLVDAVRSKLDSMDTDFSSHWLEEVYDDQVIFRVSGRGIPGPGEPGGERFYKVGYQVGEDGAITLSGDPKQIVREVTYKEVDVGSGGGAPEEPEAPTENRSNGKGKGDDGMKLVDELISSNATQFEEGDREWLDTLSECQLKKLAPVEQAQPTGNTEQAVAILREQMKKPEEFLSVLPDEYRDQFESGLALHRKQRKDLVDGIMANSEFTEEQLAPKGMGELNILHKAIVKPKVSYVGMGDGFNTNAGEEADVLPPAGIEFDVKEVN